jgi:phosphotransacetylase
MAASSTDAPSAPACTENTGNLTELIDTEIPTQPDRIQVQEIPTNAAEEADRVAEQWRVIFLSLSLLALFVVTFVSYFILAAAQLL